MLDPKMKLTLLYDNGVAVSDFTENAADFLNDTITGTLDIGQYVYIGYTKPINAAYFEIQQGNTNSSNLSVEYYDGNNWVNAEYHDDTKGFSRSGLITWEKDSMSSIAVDSNEKYYVRISTDSITTEVIVNGMNIIFSDDRELKQEFFEIVSDDFFPVGFNSHIPHHVAARNEIMQHLRNRGNLKENSNNTLVDINAFDLHDVFQVRQAATYLALAKILFNLSDNPEDNWFRKYQEYNHKYKEAISLYNLDLDSDNDGISDTNEKTARNKIFRWSK